MGAEAATGRPIDLKDLGNHLKKCELYRGNGNHGESGSGEWHQTVLEGAIWKEKGLKRPRLEAGGMQYRLEAEGECEVGEKWQLATIPPTLPTEDDDDDDT